VKKATWLPVRNAVPSTKLSALKPLELARVDDDLDEDDEAYGEDEEEE